MANRKSNLHSTPRYFFILALFVSLFKGPSIQAQNRNEHNVNLNKGLATEGCWFVTIKEDKINIEFKASEDEDSHNSSSFPLSDFKDLPRDKPGSFSLTRD